MIKIGLLGAESSGKTTLGQDLKTQLPAQLVQEQARIYLANRPSPNYQEQELKTIARLQQQAIQQATEQAIKANHAYLVADTTLLVIRIWALYRFGRCDPNIIAALRDDNYDLQVLCHYDIPWIADPLREHAAMADRRAIHALYEAYLQRMGLPFIVVRGTKQQRVDQVTTALKLLT